MAIPNIREISRATPSVSPLPRLNYKSAKEKIKEDWRHYLDKNAPPGITSRGEDNVNDAYRHYMTAAELTRLSASGRLVLRLGELNEQVNNAYSVTSTVMDLSNNIAGALSGEKSSSSFENAMNFINDVASGEILVIDEDSGRLRETSPRDLPTRDGDKVEDRYHPEKGGADGPDDMSGDGEGTIVA